MKLLYIYLLIGLACVVAANAPEKLNLLKSPGSQLQEAPSVRNEPQQDTINKNAGVAGQDKTNQVNQDNQNNQGDQGNENLEGKEVVNKKDELDTSNIEELELPPTLSTEEFDKLTGKQLVLVEFYSPYCHHCKDFFPKWKEAYQTFKRKYPQLSIDMRQVNCVENGDLCEREMIEFYPNMLLYAPVLDKDGLPTGRSKNIDSFPRHLPKTAENVVKYLQESVAEYDEGAGNLPSQSRAYTLDEMFKAISGEIDRPVFVSFWQANKKQWDSVELGGKMKFSGGCADCLHTKQVWDKLSNKIMSIADSAHIMCQDLPELCNKLELDSFKNGKTSRAQFIMFLPKDKGTIRFDYDSRVDVDVMKWWASKLIENSAYQLASARDVTEVMEYTKVLSHQPIAQMYPLKSKVTVLFYYDIDTVTPEDKAVLPHMLRTLQKSPFNIQLYQGKHKRIEENLQTMGENLINYINYDENDKYEYDKALQIATTITGKPTIIVFKDNSLVPSIFQSFAVEDMRIYKNIEKFLETAQYPFYGELKPELVSTYFFQNKKQKQKQKQKQDGGEEEKKDISKDDKVVVVVFVDLENLKQTDEQLYKLSLIAHEYNFLKRKYYFNKVLEQRKDKEEVVEKLKAQNAETDKILLAMREEVPHLWGNDDVLFTFIDKPKAKQYKYIKGWKVNPDQYEVGDAVVISRDCRYVWNKDLQGAALKNEPKQLKQVLMSLLTKDGQLLHGGMGSSLVGKAFSFLNHVSSIGFLGYILLIIVSYFLSNYIIKIVKKRRYRAQGLIGVNNGNNNHSFLPKKD